ncbi:MAG: hypothetical protein C4325_03690 [Blastocatellia bacterium]
MEENVQMSQESFDLIIIGAGPAGLSAAFEAKNSGLRYLVIEKGLIGHTVYNYPIGLTVFSTPDELEIVPGDLKPVREKPTREELLSYYVRFALENDLNIRTEEEVLDVRPVGVGRLKTRSETEFEISTNRGKYSAKNVLFAIGAMDHPRRLSVPGEDLPKVHHQFRETYPWVRKRALVVGGGNSAGEAALFLAREGAETTLAIFRADWENTDPKQGCIKYWVKQPLEEELSENCLKLFFLGRVVEIRPESVVLEDENGQPEEIGNDVVFVLIGADAELRLLERLGIPFRDGKYGRVPVYDSQTRETPVRGIFVAGHFTNERHIKGAIEAGRAAAKAVSEKLAKSATKLFETQPAPA